MKFAVGTGLGLVAGILIGWFIGQGGRQPVTNPVLAPPNLPIEASSPLRGDWSVSRTTSALTDRSSVYASTDSAPYAGRYGPQTARLTVRCFENTLGVVWNWGEATSSARGIAALRLRLDSGEPEWVRPWLADSHDAAILDGNEAIDLIARLLEADRMVAMYIPASDNAREVIFDLTGLPSVISEVQSACGW